MQACAPGAARPRNSMLAVDPGAPQETAFYRYSGDQESGPCAVRMKFSTPRHGAARWRGPRGTPQKWPWTAIGGDRESSPRAVRMKFREPCMKQCTGRGPRGVPKKTALARYSGGPIYRASPAKSANEFAKKKQSSGM